MLRAARCRELLVCVTLLFKCRFFNKIRLQGFIDEGVGGTGTEGWHAAMGAP